MTDYGRLKSRWADWKSNWITTEQTAQACQNWTRTLSRSLLSSGI